MAHPLSPPSPRAPKRLRAAALDPARPTYRVPWPLSDLAETVAAYCTPVELRQLCATSRTCHADLTRDKLASRVTWQQVQRALARFLGAPLSRPWPAECYLSGSLLYGALSGGQWRPGDADFFVPNSPAVIQDAQRWLVSNGYRIVQVRQQSGSHYGSLYLEGLVTWVRGPHDVHTPPPGPRVDTSDSDDEQFREVPPASWSDGGAYSDMLRSMGFSGAPEWTPACSKHVPGPRLQLIVMGRASESDQPMASLLGFDMPILANLCCATTLRVTAPRDVLEARTVLTHSQYEHRDEKQRRRARVECYRARGVRVWLRWTGDQRSLETASPPSSPSSASDE